MAHRKLIRPSHRELQERLGAHTLRRRTAPPPEETHAENFYYLKQMTARTPMVVVLMDGEELTGTVEWYDKNAIKLNRVGRPNLLLLKHCIKYMYKQGEPGRGPRS